MAKISTREEQTNIKDQDKLLDQLDSLFEQYLLLLDEYKSLRDGLNASLSKGFMDLARANFSATNRMRYGQDYYDERMQALKTISIDTSDAGDPQFCVIQAPELSADETNNEGNNDDDDDVEEPVNEDEKTSQAEKRKRPNADPIRWFGLFVPQPLRSAQSQFADAVDTQMARLITVDSRMKTVEIEIRRTRKYLTKAKGLAK